MVDFDSRLNSFRVNRERRLDFPTPESPISTTKGNTRGIFFGCFSGHLNFEAYLVLSVTIVVTLGTQPVGCYTRWSAHTVEPIYSGHPQRWSSKHSSTIYIHLMEYLPPLSPPSQYPPTAPRVSLPLNKKSYSSSFVVIVTDQHHLE